VRRQTTQAAPLFLDVDLRELLLDGGNHSGMCGLSAGAGQRIAGVGGVFNGITASLSARFP